MRAEDAQGTPTQIRISPSIRVYEDKEPRVILQTGGAKHWQVEGLGFRGWVYRGTSLTRTPPPLGTYRRPMPRVLGGS